MRMSASFTHPLVTSASFPDVTARSAVFVCPPAYHVDPVVTPHSLPSTIIELSLEIDSEHVVAQPTIITRSSIAQCRHILLYEYTLITTPSSLLVPSTVLPGRWLGAASISICPTDYRMLHLFMQPLRLTV